MLTTQVEAGVVPLIWLEGEMDLDCAETLRAAVDEAARGAQAVTLDFSRVSFIDSSGTGIFVRLCLDMQQRGVQLTVQALSPAVRQVFDMLRVRELVGDGTFAG